MIQYDATSLPNPQIKHAKNVDFPLNDKHSYFGLKILRQKEIFFTCLYISLFFCNNVSLFWKYAQIWRIIRESANTRLKKMFEAIFRSLKVSTSFDTLLWPLSWRGQLKKKSCFTTTLTYCILNACSSVQNCQSWSLLLLCSVVASIVVVEEEKEALYGRQHSSY